MFMRFAFIRIPRLRLRIPSHFCLVAALSLGGLLIAQADPQLVWSDEFDDNSINANNWTYDIGNGSGGWGNNELEYYTTRPENVYVTNGLLHIVARQESYGGKNYTSAKLKTTGRFSKKYGRFEFRARLPQGQGYWPALWMMPQDSVYGGWASSGEIDVMENKGRVPTNVLGTIHYGGGWPNNVHSSGPSYNFPAGDSVTNFHVYAVEWTTNAIRWYVDDHLFETQTSWWSSSNPTNTSIRNPYPAPFDQSFYLIMNLAIGGNFDGNPDGTTVFPQEMLVDYVRVYDLVAVPLPPPVLKLKVAFDDPPGTTTTQSDTNNGAVNVTLQMVNGAGVNSDYHGAANSGVAGVMNGNRALNCSSTAANQPVNPGPLASVTGANLGFGVVSNFVVSLWFKQNALMTAGANVGPRVFVLGAGTPGDTGAANSIGLKFQTSAQLYFQVGSTTATANFSTNLPTNIWIFVAAVCDGTNLKIYEGTDTNSASLISTTAFSGMVDFGSNGSFYAGNRQDRQRSFNGWIDDIRFYTGAGDLKFIENIRLQAALPSVNVLLQQSGTNLTLTWPYGTLQSSSNIMGPWSGVMGVTSPCVVAPNWQQQFYRIKTQ